MNRSDELTAVLLGDVRASPRLRAWLRTDEGRHEREATRRALQALERLYRRVAIAEGRSQVWYRTFETPIGKLFVAVSERGLLRVEFGSRAARCIAEIRERLGADVLPSETKTRRAASEIEAYLAGRRRRFDLSVDLRLASPFQRRVLEAARRIPRGKVVPYAEIARRIGAPQASRAVGQALGGNPVPIVIPCHRVVSSGGGLGGYAGGLATKRKLLALEDAA